MNKIELKTELATHVATKTANTRERLTLKRIPFKERTDQQHRVMLGCWDEGRHLKEMIRHCGLAYAFRRGRPYWVTERYCEDGPLATLIANWADCTVEEIEAWLAEKPSAEEQAAWDEHVKLSSEKYRAARAARRTARAA